MTDAELIAWAAIAICEAVSTQAHNQLVSQYGGVPLRLNLTIARELEAEMIRRRELKE